VSAPIHVGVVARQGNAILTKAASRVGVGVELSDINAASALCCYRAEPSANRAESQ